MELNTSITIRCNNAQLNKFIEWCNDTNIRYTDFIREIFDAAPNGRLNMRLNEKQKEKLVKLYPNLTKNQEKENNDD